MAKREPNHHGILVVDKPGRQTTRINSTELNSTGENSFGIAHADAEKALPTSHDIVQMARRWCQQRRIGHTGTLDPMASGLLVLCLGRATRLVEYYQNHDKQYTAQICLGHATNTYDAMGQVTESSAVPTLTLHDIEAALDGFRGRIWQTPPLFSAIKQGGESLHRKARRGETVVIEPRQITIHELQLLDFTPPDRIRLQITCSAGTYIRSLANDLGKALNSHAFLDQLRRNSAGSFALEDAHTPEAITQAAEEGNLDDLILPVGYGLTMPTVHLDEEEILRFGYGQTVLLNSHQLSRLDTFAEEDMLVAARGRAHDEFVGIIRRLPDEEADKILRIPEAPGENPLDAIAWKAEKWFANS